MYNCGIYLLKFVGTDKVYIGQSVNIPKRFQQHIRDFKSGTAAKKLLDAYKQYGLPKCIVVDICQSELLDSREIHYIAKYNSCDNGFNTYSSPYQAPFYRGVDSGNSKYSKDLIIDTMMYLCIDGTNVKDAETEFGLPVATINNILSGKQHVWFSEDYPRLINTLRNKIGKENTFRKVQFAKNNLSVKGRGILYPKVISPEGIVYVVDNINEFARIHTSISKSSLHRLLSGQVNKSKGWTRCQEEQA